MTSRCLRLILVVLCAIVLAFTTSAQDNSRLFTYSTLDALLAGVYDGDLTVSQLRAKGDFGIGTFNHLDGEMIMVDGVCYHAKSDGSVEIAKPQDKTPLAYVTRFHHAIAIKSERVLSLAELEAWLDQHVADKNLFHAIRVDGQFSAVTVRAVSPQKPPYRPLSEIVGTQVVNEYTDVRGVLIGIRSPAFSRGISVPGYHWHFISQDRKHGGHVLRLAGNGLEAQVDEIAGLDLQLPRNSGFAAADQGKDRTAEVKQVEGK